MSTGTASETIITHAGSDDIAAAAHVYQTAAHDLSDRLRASNPWANMAARSEDFEQAVRTLQGLWERDAQSVLVARNDDGISGMAALAINPPHAHIAFLFVKPEAQNKGVGRMLLEQLRERIDTGGATVVTLAASRDPRAWQRYLRFGLRPGPPLLPFRAAEPVFPAIAPEHPDVLIRRVQPDDLDLIVQIDLPVRGVDRREAIAGWLAEGNPGSMVFDRLTGEPMGYGLVSLGPHFGQIGPVAALGEESFAIALRAALAEVGGMANPRRLPWRVDCSARNVLATPVLLEAGFSLDNIVNWFESGPVGRWEHYIFRNEDDI